MNWEAAGAIGEIVGAGAVVLTLIYFSFQLRQNTKSVNSTNFNSAMQGFNSFNAVLMADTKLTGLFYKGHADPQSLGDDERLQYAQMMACVANIYRNLLHQYLDGSLPEEYWNLHAKEAQQAFLTKGGMYFKTLGPSYGDLFDYLDQLPIDGDLAFSQSIWPVDIPQSKPEV